MHTDETMNNVLSVLICVDLCSSVAFWLRPGRAVCIAHAIVRSTERPSDVVLGVLFARAGEDVVRGAALDEIAGAASLTRVHVKERRLVRDALGLLQVM